VAVKMAKAWVEESEREATPRIPSEQRVQDARVKAPPRARRIEAEKLDWPGLHEGDRFTRLLAVHSLLDRLVTLVLATRLAASRESIFDAMASLPISSRVALALTLNVVSPAAAEGILEIDRARNGLVHSKPTPGKPVWDVSGAVESESLRKGLEAAQNLMTALGAEPTPRG
jgi:hypothetical protein